MLLLWSDDCALPLRRPEHARCDYAIGIGAAVRSVGVTSSGAGAHALFERATSKRPVDPLHGMQEALRAIAEAEQEANARESLDRARAEADLDSAISLLRLLAEDPAANREERTMLNATADQASGARAAGSTRLMRDAQTLVESQVRLWVRLQEERRRVRTFRWAATTALGALAFLVMVFLWYRARRRLGTMTAAMDPAITDFDHYQARFGRAAIAVKELAQRISKVHEQLPPTATSAIVQLGGARRQFEEAERHIRAASSHLHSCAPLAGRTAKVLALFTGSCPGSDLGRRLRATYRVDMADSVSLHDAYVFGSATRTRFFSLEHAEGEVSRLYNEANGCVADVENAIQSVRTCIQVHRSGLEFNALSKRTETRHVPMVWLSQHPFLAEGPQFFLEAEMLADRNPVAAMSMIRDYERRHAEVSSVVDRIAQAIRRHALDPKLLTFEITESVAMEDAEGTLRTFERLSAIGVHLSIDDFGTGYSSLSYLRRLQAGQLKIDRAFVRDLESSADARAIVEAVVRLAHALGLKVVAEGVETAGQRDVLHALGCDELQGFLFARPMQPHLMALWAQGEGRPAALDFRESAYVPEDEAASLESRA